MRNIWWIMKRELSSYFRSPMGYVIIAVMLVIDGLLFNAFAVGKGHKFSADVLSDFFFYASGVTLFASVFMSMGLIAQERERGTMNLLLTSPVKDGEIILGKYLSALAFLTLATLMTFYMPVLLMMNGKISTGHILTGYLGLLLLGSAGLGLGVLCSTLAPNQLVAAILSAATITVFILLWLISRIASPPLEEILAYLSIHDKHFRPFMKGLIRIQDVVFYVSLTYVALLIATRTLESRRWR